MADAANADYVDEQCCPCSNQLTDACLWAYEDGVTYARIWDALGRVDPEPCFSCATCAPLYKRLLSLMMRIGASEMSWCASPNWILTSVVAAASVATAGMKPAHIRTHMSAVDAELEKITNANEG